MPEPPELDPDPEPLDDDDEVGLAEVELDEGVADLEEGDALEAQWLPPVDEEASEERAWLSAAVLSAAEELA